MSSQSSLSANFGIIRETTSKALLKAIPLPPLPDDYILVETKAVALNPTDWTTLDAPGDPGTLVGCDYAGEVLAVGPSVTKSFRVGDRVAGIAHGGNDAAPWTGAFAKYIAVKGDVQMKVPDQVSWPEASSIGVAAATAGYSLWKVLGMRMPDLGTFPKQHEDPKAAPEGPRDNEEWVLIYGGSTATGTVAVQFAKLSGYKVVTTCSPKHFDLLKDRGADVVLDYKAKDVGQQINELTGNSLRLVLDCVAVPSSADICALAFGSEGGVYCNLLGIQCPRKDVKSIFFLGYALMGESYIFETVHYDAEPEFFEFGKQYLDIVERLWEEGLWKAHPQSVRSGGLNGLFKGMEEMKEGRISGVKLVYVVDETVRPGGH